MQSSRWFMVGLGTFVAVSGLFLITGNIEAGNPAEPNTDQQMAQSDASKILHKSMTCAAKGQVLNSGGFGLGSKEEDIINAWGEPESRRKWGEFTRLKYKHRNIEFKINGDGFVDYIITNDPKLFSVSLADIENVLGRPTFDKLTNESKGLTSFEYIAKERKYVVSFRASNKLESVSVYPWEDRD